MSVISKLKDMEEELEELERLAEETIETLSSTSAHHHHDDHEIDSFDVDLESLMPRNGIHITHTIPPLGKTAEMANLITPGSYKKHASKRPGKIMTDRGKTPQMAEYIMSEEYTNQRPRKRTTATSEIKRAYNETKRKIREAQKASRQAVQGARRQKHGLL
jgi:hypothetical protein